MIEVRRMTTIELFAKNEVLELVTSPTVSSGDVNEVELYVEFSEEWQGLAKTAVFFYDEFKEPFERLLENGRCKVPNEVLKNHVPFFVGIRGAKNDILKTTDIVKYTVTKGVPSIIKDVNVDIYQQILAGYAKLETIKDEVDADAKKTAEDRKEVERLVESVSGIDEQVTKVEELSKNAQEAATQAGTSAEQAELHKQAAETASSAAQTAAQETEADRTSVEKTKETVENLSTQVQKNKESVDKTTQDFTLKAQQALADVNNAGQAQTERVQTAGTTAVENIKTAQNTATQAIEAAKTEAVKAVQTEGTTQTGNVTTEGEKQVQAVQQAAQEIIADREQIAKNKTDIADLRQNKADAIVESVSGTLLNVKDSANAFFEEFSVYGKSEQVQTTGKNLFNVDNIIQKTMPDGKTHWGYSYVLDTGDYTISCLNPNNYDGKTDYLYCRKLLNGEYSDNGIIYVVANGFPQTKKITIEQSEELVFFNATPHNESESKEKFAKYLFQLEKGASATTYEPYSGGKPSPSPEYPQEIVNAGRLNEDTGKYEIGIKVTGKNIFNVEKLNKKWSVGVRYYYIPLFVGKGSRVSFSVSKKLTTGLKVYALFSKEFGGNEKAYSWIYHSSVEGLIKAKGTFVAETDVISLSFVGDKTILINELFNYLQVEISETPTSYEPYKEQTLTLTSDRPLTKWDRLVEQNGQIGWLYGSEKYIVTGDEAFKIGDKRYYTGDSTNMFFINPNFVEEIGFIDRLSYVNGIFGNTTGVEGYCFNGTQLHMRFKNTLLGVKNSATKEVKEEAYKIYLKKEYDAGTPYEILYKSSETEFVPLPQSEQEAIRALTSYYPTTVVSNSEDMEMELSYVADTKNYTDRKIEEAVSAQVQNLANLLSLMPLSTQAAMIEADTNNILNMEVQK